MWLWHGFDKTELISDEFFHELMDMYRGEKCLVQRVDDDVLIYGFHARFTLVTPYEQLPLWEE